MRKKEIKEISVTDLKASILILDAKIAKESGRIAKKEAELNKIKAPVEAQLDKIKKRAEKLKSVRQETTYKIMLAEARSNWEKSGKTPLSLQTEIGSTSFPLLISVANILVSMDIDTIGQLIGLTREEVLRLPNMSMKRLLDTEVALAENGLAFRE
jgi:DNA-directed RNA polymerase alpha subunit